MHQRIDWDVFGLNSFVVPFECSIIYHSIKMSANVFFFLCVCHLHMADLNLASVGGQAQGMSTGIGQL